MGQKKILFIATIPDTLIVFYNVLFDELKTSDWDVVVASSGGKKLIEIKTRYNFKTLELPMRRSVSPLQDLIALLSLTRFLIRNRVDIVHAHSPKGGLLGITAAFLAGIKNRIYTVHGLPLETADGIIKKILFLSEKFTILLSTMVFSVSQSLKRKLIECGITIPKKVKVLGNGTACGIDTMRFSPTSGSRQQAKKLRGKHNIKDDDILLGFVGRVNPDKGIDILVNTFIALSQEHSNIFLILIGGIDTVRTKLSASILNAIKTNSKIITTGHVDNIIPYYLALDIFVLPSKREGFNYSLLEAASLEIPTLTTCATGCIDAVENDKTGLVVNVDDMFALTSATHRLIQDADSRISFGKNGRNRVIKKFGSQRLVDLHMIYYNNIT